MSLGALFTPLALIGQQIHTVRRGETLSSLARQYEIPIAKLAAANGIGVKSKLQAGQRLTIPYDGNYPELEAGLKQKFDRTTVKLRRWKNIVIHHTATTTATLAGLDRNHREDRHMENGLAYHFVIGNGKGMEDGEIAAGGRWKGQLAGGHLASEQLNEISLGICLVGNFEETEPTERQIHSLVALISYLLARCRLGKSTIKTHQQINTLPTQCPGHRFPFKQVLSMIR